MLGRRTRNLLVTLVRALNAGVGRLVARLEAGDRLTEAAAGEGRVAQDSARAQFVNQGVQGPPAHWVEVVRRHAPHLLRPVSGQRDAVPGLRAALGERGERPAAPEPRKSSTLGRQPAPPAAGQKTAAAAKPETLPGPRRLARQTSVAPELGSKATSRNKHSVTPEGARPQVRGRRDRHRSPRETSAHASRPAPRKAPEVCPTPRPPRQPLGASAPLAHRFSLKPGETRVLQPPPCSKARDISRGPSETLRGFRRAEGEAGSLDSEPGRGRDTQPQPTKPPEGAQGAKRMIAPLREAMPVAPQATPRAERSGTSTSREEVRSAPSLGTTPAVQLPLRSTGEAVSSPLQAEPQWPRLPDEMDWDPQSTGTGADRWPSLPEYAWDPQARLSPSEALWAATEEGRTALRLRRRDLEQRGDLWSA